RVVPPPTPTLFPYTTLFRSNAGVVTGKPTASPTGAQTSLVRGLGPLDATMIVIGSMIGSGIFITSAESARLIGAPGWLLLAWARSEEHTSELQSRSDLVCRL